MRPCTLLCLVLLCSVYAVLVVPAVSEPCARAAFHLLSPAVKSPGALLRTYSQLSRQLCERTCRQYLDCTAYRVHYRPNTTSVQSCDVLRSAVHQPYTATEHEQLYAKCPDKMFYVATNQRCYGVVNQLSQNFDDATSTCRRFDPEAFLAEGKTPVENNVLFDIAVAYNFDYLWLGLRASQPYGAEYLWQKAQVLADYVTWAAGEPNNFNGLQEDCVILGTETDSPAWHDNECSKWYPFVCQY